MKDNFIEKPKLPGVSGVWTFITMDMLSFTMFFIVFMFERSGQVELFNDSARHLNANLGMMNALILLTSSWLVVLAVRSAREGNRQSLRRFLLLSILVGAGFAVSKMFEYNAKISSGITMLTNDFYMFYYILTGIHFFHFLIGMTILIIFWFKAEKEDLKGAYFGWLESGGVYWHMVDLLWIILFPMLYLLGGS